MTFLGVSNITTLDVSVNHIPASEVCGTNIYVVLVAIFLEKATNYVNMTDINTEEHPSIKSGW